MGRLLALLLILFLAYLLLPANGCKEAVCASIVSKCMLTQSCKCDAKNTSCSKDCFFCLDYLYTECCSCVEMCPKLNEVESLSQKSHVEDLAEPFPDLFSVLTEEKDRLFRWTSYTYPAQISFISLDKEVKLVSATVDSNVGGEEGENTQVNCTVAFMSQCMSWNKCKSSCSSMGASSYRWFHDGCCECVGATCLNYGINESRCLECPPDKEESTVEQEIVTDGNEADSDMPKYVVKMEDEEETTEAQKENDDDDTEKIQKVDA